MMKWIAVRTAVVLALVLTAMPAAAAIPALMDEMCGEVGTWQGLADNGFAWMNTITRGASNTTGQLDLAWIVVDPTLGGAFPGATGVTGARGVWEKAIAQGVQWTWIAYGLGVDGRPVYVIRASGTHAMPDCDHLDIAYVLQVFLPTQDMNTEPPIACLEGTARETRMALVQSSCGQ